MADGSRIVALLPASRAQRGLRFVVVGLNGSRDVQLLDAFVDALHANVKRAQIGVARSILRLQLDRLLVRLGRVRVIALAAVEVAQGEPRGGVVLPCGDGLLDLGDGLGRLALPLEDQSLVVENGRIVGKRRRSHAQPENQGTGNQPCMLHEIHDREASTRGRLPSTVAEGAKDRYHSICTPAEGSTSR